MYLKFNTLGELKMRKKMDMNPSQKLKTFDEGFDEFVLYCKVRNLSPSTIKHYEDIVNHVFYKFIDYKVIISKITQNMNEWKKAQDSSIFDMIVDIVITLKAHMAQQEREKMVSRVRRCKSKGSKARQEKSRVAKRLYKAI